MFSFCRQVRTEKIERYMDPLWANPDTAMAVKVVRFYNRIFPDDLASVRGKITFYCDIKYSHEHHYLGKTMRARGDFSVREKSTGKVCAWNHLGEFLHYGEFGPKGALRGVSTWWYADHISSMTRFFPDKNSSIQRNWYWVRNNYVWSGVLSQVTITFHSENRTVMLSFDRYGGGLLRRLEYLDGDEKKRTGLFYTSERIRGKPNCLIYEQGAVKKTITGSCPLPDDRLPRGNRFN